jgi:hypothetical protein
MKKEKADRQLIIKMQPSLYEEFEKKCAREYRTVSEVVRELMSKYIRGWILVEKEHIMQGILKIDENNYGCEIEMSNGVIKLIRGNFPYWAGNKTIGLTVDNRLYRLIDASVSNGIVVFGSCD